MSEIETQLLEETINRLDLSEYCIVTTDTSVRETVGRMRDMGRHCAFIVGEQTRLAGLVTERDVLKKVVTHPEVWDQPVESIMTADPASLDKDATAQEALRLMESRHFRNVPVVHDNKVIVGNVTHYAILDYLVNHFSEAVYNLPPDPDNYANERAGG